MIEDRLELVQWSDFARNGRKYREDLETGRRFVILVNGEPVALVTPITREDITITIAATQTQGEK